MFLAIDSGGSKTDIRVYKFNGEPVFQKKIRGFALAVDSEEPIPELETAIADIVARYQIEAAAFNVGGKNVNQARATLERTLSNIPFSVFRESDGTAALTIGKMNDSELVLLAGTGAIIVGHDPGTGRCIVAGGWGANISDEGSGYSIGLNALRRSILAMDGTEALTPLTKAITGRETPLSAETDVSRIRDARDKVRANFFPLERSHIASFAKITAEYCSEGDPLALELYSEAGAALGRLVIQAANKLGLKQIHGLTVTGGLVNARQYWQQAMEDTVNAGLIVSNYHYMLDGLMTGTFEIAKKLIPQQEV